MAMNGTAEQIASIKSDIKALRNDFKALIGDVTDLRDNATSDVKSRISETADTFTDAAAQTKNDVERTVLRKVASGRQTVRKNPLTSVAAAFGIGVVLSRLIR